MTNFNISFYWLNLIF